MNDHTSPAMLERYAFIWLLLLLLFSAVAMFLGARPLVFILGGYSSNVVYLLLELSWVICGVAAVYLTYQWMKEGKKIFGCDDTKDTVAFWFMLLSGYNLGITGFLGHNIFLQIVMGRVAFYATSIVSLGVAYYLYKRWQGNGEQLFGSADGKQTEVVSESVSTTNNTAGVEMDNILEHSSQSDTESEHHHNY